MDRIVKKLGLIFALCMAITGCGGGSDSKSGQFQINSNTVEFRAIEGLSAPATRSVNGSVSDVDQSVYLYVDASSTTLIANAYVSISGTSGTLDLIPAAPFGLNVGSYTGTIRVSACFDANCDRHLSGSPVNISINYIVEPDPLLIDTDGDGIPDVSDAFPNNARENSDFDQDGTGDNADTDDDNDNVDDENDLFPFDANESSDIDGDGIGDNADADRDGDSFDNMQEELRSSDPNDPSSIPTLFSVVQNISLTYDDSSISDETSAIIQVNSNNGNNINWEAEVNAPWINFEPSTGSVNSESNLTLQLVESEMNKLEYGEHIATVSLRAQDPLLPSVEISITLNQIFPKINYVSPYVAYEDTVDEEYVVLTGVGFNNLTQDILFGDLAALSINIVNDHIIHVIPPALSSGEYEISLSSDVNTQFSDALLIVKDSLPIPDSSITSDIEIVERVIYDDEREVIFAVHCYFCHTEYGGTSSVIYRFEYNDTWNMTSHRYENLFDIAMSPDGKELLVVSSDTLYHVNPETMETIKTVDLPFQINGSSGQVATLNTGELMFVENRQVYSLIDGTFSASPNQGRVVGISVSPDKGFAVTGDTNNPDINPLRFYNTELGSWVNTTSGTYHNGRSTHQRHGEVSLISSMLYDKHLNLLGEMPVASDSAVMSPDGRYVYALNYLAKNIQVFDISIPAAYVELAPIEISYPGVARLAISLDGNNLFLVGEDLLVVKDLTDREQ